MSQCIYDEDGASNTAGEHNEVVDRMIDIYESVDSLETGHSIGLNARTEVTQSSVHQQIEVFHPGWILFRSRTLWLGLLCFILLTVIVVIECHSRNRLQTHIKSGEESRKQILLELNHFCKDGCTAFNSSFYYISSAMKSWESSRQDCKDRGADLLIVDSNNEQAFIISLNQRFWIGLSFSTEEGVWKWVDGSILNSTRFWGRGQPHSKSGQVKDSCVHAHNRYFQQGWNNDNCANTQQWICEKVQD